MGELELVFLNEFVLNLYLDLGQLNDLHIK